MWTNKIKLLTRQSQKQEIENISMLYVPLSYNTQFCNFKNIQIKNRKTLLEQHLNQNHCLGNHWQKHTTYCVARIFY